MIAFTIDSLITTSTIGVHTDSPQAHIDALSSVTTVYIISRNLLHPLN